MGESSLSVSIYKYRFLSAIDDIFGFLIGRRLSITYPLSPKVSIDPITRQDMCTISVDILL